MQDTASYSVVFDSGALDHVEVLLSPLSYLWDPSRRICLLYLLPALVFVAVWSKKRGARVEERRPFGAWRGASSRLDLKLWLIHAFFGVLGFGTWLVPGLTVMAFVAGVLTLSFGSTPPLAGFHPSLIAGLFTVVFLLCDDASRYFLHLAFHRIPALWEIHKVHHTADVLTPLTLYRIHPFESLCYQMRGGLVQGAVTGVFFYLFRDALGAWEILGVNVFGFVFNVFGANLRHSHVFLSFGQHISRWFISPAMHQIHHSTRAQHFDRNLGSFLAVWDRLCGTLLVPEGKMELEFGVEEHSALEERHCLRHALITPLVLALGRLRPRALGASRPAVMPVPR
jgi:sterol desaturase/sphingolipid hydroxylase (fatty acid hydroxylase superfamily)